MERAHRITLIRSRNQNSILAVATLGVYLGLILAGATPSVLAQAATAKQFNVKDEVAKRDDLDNKPDDCDWARLREKVTDYETRFLWFNHNSVNEYTALVDRVLQSYPDKTVEGIDVSWKSDGDFRPTRKIKTSLGYPYGFLNADDSHWLDEDVLFVGNGLPGKSFEFSVLRNAFGNQFRFESQQVPYDAPLVRALYNSAIDLEKCNDWWHSDLILRNSELFVEKDHLIITTRLARGSLDRLLASNAK